MKRRECANWRKSVNSSTHARCTVSLALVPISNNADFGIPLANVKTGRKQENVGRETAAISPSNGAEGEHF